MKNLRPVLLAALLTFTLCACTTIQAIVGANVTQGQIDTARASYDGLVLAPSTHYRELSLCAAGQTFIKNQCRTHRLTVQLQQSDHNVQAAFDDVQVSIDQGNGAGAVAAWKVLGVTIDTAKKIIADNGISF